VRLTVYNLLGQPVRTLVDHGQVEGFHRVQWDGRDALGREVTSGVYIYRLEAGTDVAVRKMVFVK
jgi:flagellar hook assembly protein FlgD